MGHVDLSGLDLSWPKALDDRLQWLLAENQDRELTREEQAEADALVQLANTISVLHLRAGVSPRDGQSLA